MPLFQFNCYENITNFDFNYPGLSLKPFTEKDIPRFQSIPGLSKIDIGHINQEKWALVYQVDNNNDDETYKEFVNLLLIAFHIFYDNRAPFIKYRINTEKSSSCLTTLMDIYNPEMKKNLRGINLCQLKKINKGFTHLQKMYCTSARTKNALYFLSKIYMFEQWSESFVMMMIVLEALFSKDEPPYNNTKEIICQRASSLLNSCKKCTKKDIEKLYDLRCDIVHGRIDFKNIKTKNLQESAHLEFVVNQCFRELIANDRYKHFETPSTREEFMATLDNKSHGTAEDPSPFGVQDDRDVKKQKQQTN